MSKHTRIEQQDGSNELRGQQETEIPKPLAILVIDKDQAEPVTFLHQQILHTAKLPYTVSEVMGVRFQNSVAELSDLLEFTAIAVIDESSSVTLNEQFPNPETVFIRFPNLQAIVQTKGNQVTITSPDHRVVLETPPDSRASLTSDLVAYLGSQNDTYRFSIPAYLTTTTAKVVTFETKTQPSETVALPETPEKSIRAQVRDAITNGDIPPFVYTYPPRSSYEPLSQPVNIAEIWQQDLANSGTRDLNLYIHYPFCRYKCDFCNLYTVTNVGPQLIDLYTQAVVKQLQMSEKILRDRKLVTIYIGGGTPMLMTKENFGQIADAITALVPNWRETVVEFCMEASPDSVVNPTESGTLEYFISQGMTRTNLGLQSTEDSELIHMGRPVSAKVGWEAIDILKTKGLRNLSTDLIMGFADQTEESWMKSVWELLERDPETISTYFLTVRPDNRFGRTGRYTFYRDPKLYRWYERARQEILARGYVQESNVRYIKPGRGGYEQKVRQFHGTPILGVGAGSRSYTQTMDYIIGGDSSPSRKQIVEFINAMEAGDQTITAGFVYDEVERIRKRFALDLFKIDLSELAIHNFVEHQASFMPLLEALILEKLVVQTGPTQYQLTGSGFKYRDIISWMLFSDHVIDRDTQFYMGLQMINLVNIEARKK